jgi:hypothetical protein
VHTYTVLLNLIKVSVINSLIFLLQSLSTFIRYTTLYEYNNLTSTEMMGFVLFPSSGILENRKHDVSVAGSLSVLKCGGKASSQLGPLEKVNLSYSDY